MTLLYPGSFNPVHKGHLRLAEYALEQTQADELWFVVSPNNPLKAAHELWDERLRFELLQEATAGKEKMRVSDVEFELPRPSYTANTLRALQTQFPDKEFALLIGEDNMMVFDKWREHDWILENYPIWVYPRSQNQESGAKNQDEIQHSTFCILQDAPLCPISSTQIRERLREIKEGNVVVDAASDAVLRWVPEAVLARLV